MLIVYTYIYIYYCLRYHKEKRGEREERKIKGILLPRYHKEKRGEREERKIKGILLPRYHKVPEREIEISMYGAFCNVSLIYHNASNSKLYYRALYIHIYSI